MADRSIQQRNMRKAVERVDVGAFGVPMKIIAWRRRMRSTWGGFAALSAGHAVAGLAIALVLGMAFHISVNPLSIACLAAFVIGCVIGGPLSFTLWSAVLIGLTGLVGGIVAGAWVSSPTWWRQLAAVWNSGGSVPGWFMVAVPTWILTWIATSFIVSRALESLADRMSLRVGFNAASRFAKEDNRISTTAFAESDLSAAEARAILDGGDGTTTVVAINPPMVDQGVKISKPSDLGEERSPLLSMSKAPVAAGSTGATGGLDYDRMLDNDMSDPLIRKASGLGEMAIESERDVEVLPGIPASDQPPARPVSVQMGPATPIAQPSQAPTRATPPPRLDAHSTRSMMRRLTQLVLAFNTAEHEGSTDQFIIDNEDEFAQMSDEQMRLLGTIDDAGPLVGFAKSIKDARLGQFMLGRADPPAPVGTGSLAGADEAAEPSPTITGDAVAPSSAETVAADAETMDDDDAEDVVVKPGSMASMAESLASMLRPQSGARSSAVATPLSDDTSSQTATTAADVSADADPPIEVPVASPHDAVDVTPAQDEASPSSPAPVTEPVSEPGVVVALDGAGNRRSFVLDTQASQTEPQAPVDDAGAAANGSMSRSDAQVHDHDGDDRLGSDTEVSEDDMTALVFTRLICRQVHGLVSGSHDIAETAADVVEFERANPGTLVSQVLNSRSFDEHVGSDAAVKARHAWIEVQKILSQSNTDRLIADFERVNARGRQLLEEPHMLTQPAFYAFDRDSVRLRQAVGVNDETMARAMPLYRENAATHDALEKIMTQRAEAPAIVHVTPGTQRQRIAVGEDIRQVARGKSLVGSVLSGTRDAGLGSVLADTDAPIPPEPGSAAPTTAEPPVPASAAAVVSVNDTILKDAQPVADVTANETPMPGDENFVSSYPQDSDEYVAQMEEHEALLPVRRRQRERADQQRQERENEARRAADAARDTLADADRREAEERRERLLREDRDFIESQRLASLARAETARLEAEAARVQNERAERESKRSIADQAILDAHHARFADLHVPRRFSSDAMFLAVSRLAELRDLRSTLMAEHLKAPRPSIASVADVVSSSTRRPLAVVEFEIGRHASAIRKTITDILELPATSSLNEVLAVLGGDDEAKKFFTSIDTAMTAGISAGNEFAAAEDELRRLVDDAAGASDAQALREQLAALEDQLGDVTTSLETVRGEKDAAVSRAETAEATMTASAELVVSLRKELAGVVDDEFQVMLDKHGVSLDDRARPGFYMLIGAGAQKLALVATFPAGSLPSGMIERGGKLRPLIDEVRFLFTKFQDIDSEMSFHYVDPKLRSVINDNSGLLSSPLERSPEALLDLLRETGVVMEEK